MKRFTAGTIVVGAAVAILAACTTDRIAAPGPSFTLEEVPGGAAHHEPQVARVKVCPFGPEATTVASFTTVVQSGDAGAAIESPSSALSGLCTITFIADDAANSNVRVTLVEDYTIDRIFTWYSDGTTENQEPPAAGVNFKDVTVNSGLGVVLWFKLSGEEPPDDPGPCVGLTPGYWKNWDNHYTEEQFAALIVGTIAGSIDEAEDILGYGGPDPLQKLAKFVLANQLTLNLSDFPVFPNPDGAFLDEDCEVEGDDLGDALETALDMLNGVGGPYSRNQINAIKNILDAIANMD